MVRTALAAAARVQLWELGTADGPPQAALCAIVDRGVAFHLKTAYDERFAAHSPGLQPKESPSSTRSSPTRA